MRPADKRKPRRGGMRLQLLAILAVVALAGGLFALRVSFRGAVTAPVVGHARVLDVIESHGSQGAENVRAVLHTAFRALASRGELPGLLNELGLVGEGVEVGVREGDHSKWILEHWRGRKLHMVDPWARQDAAVYQDISNRDQQHQQQLFDELGRFMREQHPQRHALHRTYSVEAAKSFPDDTFDFVYIDARHDYLGVKEDLEAWWPKLRQGGLLAGHDFVPDGTHKEGAFGVQQAVLEFTQRENRMVQSISAKLPNGGREEPQHVDGGWTTFYFFK